MPKSKEKMPTKIEAQIGKMKVSVYLNTDSVEPLSQFGEKSWDWLEQNLYRVLYGLFSKHTDWQDMVEPEPRIIKCNCWWCRVKRCLHKDITNRYS